MGTVRFSRRRRYLARQGLLRRENWDSPRAGRPVGEASSNGPPARPASTTSTAQAIAATRAARPPSGSGVASGKRKYITPTTRRWYTAAATALSPPTTARARTRSAGRQSHLHRLDVQRGGQHGQLAPESGQRRHARQAQQQHRHGPGHERRRPPDAGQLIDVYDFVSLAAEVAEGARTRRSWPRRRRPGRTPGPPLRPTRPGRRRPWLRRPPDRRASCRPGRWRRRPEDAGGGPA